LEEFGGSIIGSDIFMDGGVTAAYWCGDLGRARPTPGKD
jgi:hypothetical protein